MTAAVASESARIRSEAAGIAAVEARAKRVEIALLLEKERSKIKYMLHNNPHTSSGFRPRYEAVSQLHWSIPAKASKNTALIPILSKVSLKEMQPSEEEEIICMPK